MPSHSKLTVHFDNVDFNSTSGPNRFAFRLADNLSKRGHMISPIIGCSDIDAQLSCIQINETRAPTALRLDGIYFNLDQDYVGLNKVIETSYKKADAIIVQSIFNRELTKYYFGDHPNVHVIPNGTNLEAIANTPPIEHTLFNKYDDVWVCAASWRPHKRLDDNIRYFIEHAPEGTCLVVAGPNAHNKEFPHVYYGGNMHPDALIALYKRASHFIHLAFLDHCPNVVVNARAAGCRIVCTTSGGTHEIAGKDAIVIKDLDWDYEPLRLYEPPELDFNSTIECGINSELDINLVANQYLDVFRIIKA